MGNISRFGVADFLALSDTPAAFAGSANQFARVNATPDALVFFDLFGTANTWTADQTLAADILANTDDTHVVGTPTSRFAEVCSVNGRFVQGDGTVTIDAGFGGIIAGRSNNTGGGSATLHLGGGAYPPACVIGNAYTSSTNHTALMQNQAGGGVMFGAAFCGGGGTKTATIRSTNQAFGSFTGGYAYATSVSGADALIENSGVGAFLWAYVDMTVLGQSKASAAGAGAFCQGRLTGGTHVLKALGVGAFCQGFGGGTNTSTIEATGSGAFAQGRSSSGGTIRATLNGSFAQGNANANNCIIEATGSGAMARGHANAGYDIRATAFGALAIGAALTGDIEATANNAFQFGQGANALTNSLKVGNAGLRLKGTVGAPGTPANGDIWLASGYVYIRSNGSSVKIV